MNLTERAKNILINPKSEWLVIETETTNPQSLLTSYVIPLALVSALGSVIMGLLWPGLWGMQFWLTRALINFLTAIIGYYIASYVIDALAPSFGSEKNINRSAQLVAYSNTAGWVASFFSFIPVIGWLIALAGGIYSIYLLYLGIGPMKKTPEDKKVVYMIISFLVIIVITMVVGAILGSIFLRSSGYSYGWGF